MPAMDSKTVVKRFLETLNQERAEELEKHLTPDFVNHDPRPGETAGPKGFVQALRTMKQAFPDFHVDPVQMIAEGDRVAVQVRAKGKQRGDYLGHPPTDQPTSWEGLVLFRVENGKLAERWAKIEFAGSKQMTAGPSITMMPTEKGRQPAK